MDIREGLNPKNVFSQFPPPVSQIVDGDWILLRFENFDFPHPDGRLIPVRKLVIRWPDPKKIQVVFHRALGNAVAVELVMPKMEVVEMIVDGRE